MATVSNDDQTSPLQLGKTLFDYADELAVQVPTSCFRAGQCHECIVQVEEGLEALNEPTEAESFLRDHYRLACQATVEHDDTDIRFSPLRRTPQILVDNNAPDTTLELAPIVTRRGDSVYYNGELIDRYRGHIYGLAVDLGTTTVALDLLDLESGQSLCISSFENPQRFGGSDVMHRISYDGSQHQGELQKAIAAALNHQIQTLAKRFGFTRQEIYEVVVAGNSTMRDILFKWDVQGIGQKPYKSLVENEFRNGQRPHTALTTGSRRLGLRVNPFARVYGLPLIASHVGGDTAAALVALDIDSQTEVVMLVDVGTNTEVVVGHAGRLLACSCPAGPAFEGGLIEYGMPGYNGAIESVRYRGDGRFDYSTIGDTAPQGLCGSGLIDLLAQLRRHDLMTPKGVFAERKQRKMTVVPDQGITLSRLDASNLAQAKAANYCGQFIALRHFGVDPADITRLYLAGGFANYVDIDNAIAIGFLAPVPRHRISKVGNAALQGARQVLLSVPVRQRLETMVQDIEHIELETTADFFELFVEGCQFKPMPQQLAPTPA